MAFVERRSGRWRARYRGPDKRERSRTFDRKVDAERFLVTVEADKLQGRWTDPRLAQTTVAEWSARWLAAKTDVKPKTRAGYEGLLRTLVLPAFGHLALGHVQTVDAREWQAELARRGLSASRRRQALQLLGAVMTAAVESGYIARSPVEAVKPPRAERREQRFLTAAQVQVLVDAVDPEHRVLLYVLAYGGLRWGEAAALRRRRVDLLRGRLHVAESLAEVDGQLVFGSTKTHRARMVALPPFLRDELTEHLRSVAADPDALVFTRDGAPLRHRAWTRRVWHPALRAAGLPTDLRIHDLRHTCASLLIAQGAHPKAVQAHLGHSTVAVTLDCYGHLLPAEHDRLADGLDAAFRAAAASVRPGDGPPGVAPLHPRGGEHAV